VALDTNILLYAEGANGPDMRSAALSLINRLPADDVVVPAEVIGELYNVLTRKAGLARDAAREVVLSWRDTYALIGSTAAVTLGAIDLAADHGFSIWDAIVLSAAAEAGCRLLLSQDLHEGFTWKGVTITNPFGPRPHPLLAAILESGEA
jgi:predicted nucleic acid-binding protein